MSFLMAIFCVTAFSTLLAVEIQSFWFDFLDLKNLEGAGQVEPQMSPCESEEAAS
jgi:hypothetical protein